MDYIRVVLVQPSHPGNIGATARAMANMGVSDLHLVRPKEFPSSIADARAVGADWILSDAKVHPTLSEAIAPCGLVIGTTARMREIAWPQKSPPDAMQAAIVAAQDTPVALVFGAENSGLKNAELDACHFLVQIPVAETFSSLNLGAAVMVMLYELRMAAVRAAEDSNRTTHEAPNVVLNRDDLPASHLDMQHFYDHLHGLVDRVDFAKGGVEKIQRKIVRLFNRAQMSNKEVKLLRGLLKAIDKKIEAK